MKVLLVLPHRDVTLRPSVSPPWSVVDLSRAFCERVLRGPLTDAEAVNAGTANVSPEVAKALLLERVSSSLIARDALASLHGGLRVLGARLMAASAEPSAVRLRLDDLDLARGTTERTGDVQLAAAGPLPFEPELAAGLEAVADAEEVCLHLERDQQLPAAVWVASRLRAAQSLSLTGAFARVHVGSLKKLEVFSRATLRTHVHESDRLCAPPGIAGPVPDWRWYGEPYRGAGGGGPWAGILAPEALRDPHATAQAGCRMGVLQFCAVRDDGVLTADGQVLPHAVVERTRSVFRELGTALLGEWWVGAPGVDEAAHEATLSRLSQSPFDRIVGVRRFHWSGQVQGTSFGGVPVQLGSAPADRDLARSVPFVAPGTLEEAQVSAGLERCALAVLKAGQGAPGRIAGAYVVAEPEGRGTPGVALDPDCAVVELPVSLTGVRGSAWYAAQLKTGAILGLDGRIGPLLAAMVEPTPRARVLPALPDAQRGKIVSALLLKGVLREVGE